MTENELFAAIGSIDDKWLTEAQADGKIRKSNNFKAFLPVAACFFAAAAVFGLWKSGILSKKISDTPAVLPSDGIITENTSETTAVDLTTEAREEIAYDYEPALTTSVAPTATRQSTENNPDDEQKYAGDERGTPYTDTKTNTMGTDTTSASASKKYILAVTGEAITDSEALDFLNTGLSSLLSSLSASGVNTANAHFSQKGYSHISLDGNTATAVTNFRDYLLYSDDKLIAIVTLVKENGIITSTPAFGGTWFDSYNAFLNEHRGEKLLYVYSGLNEFVITPDNRAYSTVGEELTDIGILYNDIYHDSAVYEP